ncbi:hypothetical protein EDD11_003884 [Mortierella claussenii]|nr:hypothetical protein EDD11_003884 [Mortierella claussenii]
MHLLRIPADCIHNVCQYLSLSDQHSLLLTCRTLFHRTVPSLYRSPFRAILDYDDWKHLPVLPHARNNSNITTNTTTTTTTTTSSSSSSSNVVSDSAFGSHPVYAINTATTTTTGGAGNRFTSRLNNISSSSLSSVSTTCTTTSSISTVATPSKTTGSKAAHRTTSPPEGHYTTTSKAQVQAKGRHPHHSTKQKRPASLQQRSYSDHPKSSSSSNSHASQVNLRARGNSSSSSHVNNNNNSTGGYYSNNGHSNQYSGILNINALHSRVDNHAIAQTFSDDEQRITPLQQFKLNKITRLLQLLIACTSVQARLPALRYPGYGQQWIRPPCKVDYLQYYIDHQQSAEVMIQCFHLLFADLIPCRSLDEDEEFVSSPPTGTSHRNGGSSRGVSSGSGGNTNVGSSRGGSIVVPVSPPDKEAYKVLYQILREFMTHNASKIRTLSVSGVHTIEHATALVPQLSSVKRLELTDLDQQNEWRVDLLVDFIKSHRMLFGPVLKHVVLADKSSSVNIRPSITTSKELSPTLAPLFTMTTTTKIATTAAAATATTTTAAAITAITAPSSPLSPASALAPAFAVYAARIPSVNSFGQNHVVTALEAFKALERIDAASWPNCVLYLDHILPSLPPTPLRPLTTVPSPMSVSSMTPPTLSSSSTVFSSIPSSLKSLWLSYSFPASESLDSKAARLSEILTRCRSLTEVRLPIRRADVFAWAAAEKKTALISAPIVRSSKTKRLPGMRRIHLQGPTVELMDCVQDALFAFQDTLEDLEASSRLRVWQPTALEWEWTMPRLRRLKLEGEVCLYFCLESLQRCPVLEELELALTPLGDQQQQQQQQDPGKSLLLYIRSREMYRIGTLRKLRSLVLRGPWQIPDRALRRIADQCGQLKEFMMDQAVGMTTGGLLLAVENMTKLEVLNLMLSVVDLQLVRVVAHTQALVVHGNAMGWVFSANQKTAHRNCPLANFRLTIKTLGNKQTMNGIARTAKTSKKMNDTSAKASFQIKK